MIVIDSAIFINIIYIWLLHFLNFDSQLMQGGSSRGEEDRKRDHHGEHAHYSSHGASHGQMDKHYHSGGQYQLRSSNAARGLPSSSTKPKESTRKVLIIYFHSTYNVYTLVVLSTSMYAHSYLGLKMWGRATGNFLLVFFVLEL